MQRPGIIADNRQRRAKNPRQLRHIRPAAQIDRKGRCLSDEVHRLAVGLAADNDRIDFLRAQLIGQLGIIARGPAFMWRTGRTAGNKSNKFLRQNEFADRRIEPAEIERPRMRHIRKAQLRGEEFRKAHIFFRRPQAGIFTERRRARPVRPERPPQQGI